MYLTDASWDVFVFASDILFSMVLKAIICFMWFDSTCVLLMASHPIIVEIFIAASAFYSLQTFLISQSEHLYMILTVINMTPTSTLRHLAVLFKSTWSVTILIHASLLFVSNGCVYHNITACRRVTN